MRAAASQAGWAGLHLERDQLFSALDVRIRDVRTGPDGLLYLLTPKRVVRVHPAGDG